VIEGKEVGLKEGRWVGKEVGERVGSLVGAGVGKEVGADEGTEVGVEVGEREQSTTSLVTRATRERDTVSSAYTLPQLMEKQEGN
jgi:hypothetical protein